MDPAIWSRLPLEILLIIIRSATSAYGWETGVDSETGSDIQLQKWLRVVRGNKTLHTTVLSQRWASATIYWHDLICDADDFLNTDDDHDTHRKWIALCSFLGRNNYAGFIRDELLLKDHGVIPAQCIGTLNLFLAMIQKNLSFFEPLSHRVVRKNLEYFLPLMKSVKHIRVEGPPSDTILDVLSQCRGIQLKSFGIEPGYCDYKYSSHKDDPSYDVYDWTKLASFKTLTKLSIAHLSENQCPSLCLLLPELPHLEWLNLEAPRSESQPTSRHASPLRALFANQQASFKDGQMDQAAFLMSILPLSLRELRLEDVFHLGTNLLDIPPAPINHHFQPSRCLLKVLLTQFVDLISVKNLLSWTPNAELEALNFAPVIHDAQGNALDSSDSILNISNEIVKPHKLALRSIIFNDAWEIPPGFADRFNMYWSQDFAITDVILGTNCIHKDSCNASNDGSRPKHLKHALFGCGEDVNRWGTSVQRLRVDPSWTAHEVDTGAADLLSLPGLQQLRILILGHDQSCSAGDDGGFPATEHQLIADRLANLAPPTLRYIRLCNYGYWLPTKTSSGPLDAMAQTEIKIVAQPISPAADDAISDIAKAQSDFSSWLTRQDEDFLNGIPHASYLSSHEDVTQEHLNPYWLQQYNFLVARRLH